MTSVRKLNAHLWQREPHEHYVEEHWCSRRLFDVEPFEGTVWDPACGWGRICDSALATGHTITYSDIVDRGYDPHGSKIVSDFLSLIGPVVDNIVTNPPFDLFEQFARHALTLTRRKVAMIWLVRRLNAAHWLKQTPLRRIYLMTPRPSMPPGARHRARRKARRRDTRLLLVSVGARVRGKRRNGLVAEGRRTSNG